MIKIVGVDFDSTLVDHSSQDEKIGRELVDRLSALIQSGGHAGIVTGRPYDSVIRALAEYKIDTSIFPSFIIYREAYIAFCGDNVSYEQKKAADEWNTAMNGRLYDLCSRIMPHINQWLSEISSHGIKIRNFYVFGDYAFEFHVETNEIAERTVELLKEITLRDGFPDAEVHRNTILVSVVHNKGGKGNVLSEFTKIVDCKPSEVLAVGDSFNDLTMLDGKHGFNCGCVGNAEETLKETVKANGGYCASGRAWRGILELYDMLSSRKDI